MSGHSLHKKDWLELGLLGALGGTGLGLAGVGPMAGLLGGMGSSAALGTGAIGAGTAADAIPGIGFGASDLLTPAVESGLPATQTGMQTFAQKALNSSFTPKLLGTLAQASAPPPQSPMSPMGPGRMPMQSAQLPYGPLGSNMPDLNSLTPDQRRQLLMQLQGGMS